MINVNPDPSDMKGHITRMGDHMLEALQIVTDAMRSFEMPQHGEFNEVVICGMGGSAIGGDLAASYLRDVAVLPVEVVRSYRLPKHVSKRSLVIVSSYSGNTAESLTLFEQAVARGATILCVTTGGELATRAAIRNLPIIKLPGGMQPRAALAYSFVPLLVALSSFFELGDPQISITETAYHLKELSVLYGQATSGNSSYDLAATLRDKIAVVYSSDDLSSVNLRWRGQLQENANHLAFGNVLPELTHNEINAWEFPAGFADGIHLIALRDAEDEHSEVTKKMDATISLLSKRGVKISQVRANGKNKLERFFSLISLADWTSYHLALLQHIDPTGIPAIDELKASSHF